MCIIAALVIITLKDIGGGGDPLYGTTIGITWHHIIKTDMCYFISVFL
jgi:hypothetical protein